MNRYNLYLMFASISKSLIMSLDIRPNTNTSNIIPFKELPACQTYKVKGFSRACKAACLLLAASSSTKQHLTK